MMGKAFDICFIQTVEKHPELYDYTFKDYGKENITNNAWCEVAMEVKLTGKHNKNNVSKLNGFLRIKYAHCSISRYLFRHDSVWNKYL